MPDRIESFRTFSGVVRTVSLSPSVPPKPHVLLGACTSAPHRVRIATKVRVPALTASYHSFSRSGEASINARILAEYVQASRSLEKGFGWLRHKIAGPVGLVTVY